ncbi:calymmin isoform X5 [Pimephales promelas]|uniref:calymmin isoform X5 n=1 Tax=Pimephales promelas TaxID=90988 RepID=UPI0019558952|nr:calymmin isoform X5 [Pimephales promelas]
MLKWNLLRMMLLLWMTKVTLQGGTGYQPQNPSGGGVQMSPGGYPVNKGTGAYGSAQNKPGYGGHPPYGNGNGNGYRAPSFGGYSNLMGTHPQKGTGLGYGAGSAAVKGQNSNPGVSAGYTNGGATKTQSKQGYGGYPNGGAANQPNTGSSLQNMGYPNGGTKGPKPGYGAKAGPSNGQGAKPNGYGGYPNGGAANQPNTGSFLQNMGYPNGGTKGPKPGYGAKAGPSNGQASKPNGNGGYPNGGAANQPNTGSSPQNMGYPNGGTKGPKPGYGAIAGPSSGQGAKSNGYGGYLNGGAANQPNTGYPNGGTKGPKPGYGAKAGPSTGQAAKPNGYGGYPNGGAANQPNTGSALQNMGYPNGGTKGPKSGYGAKAGPSNGQGAKPNGNGGYPNGGAANQPNTGSSLQNMGHPNGGTKGPKPGYGAKAGPSPGQAAKPNGNGGYPNGGAANQPNTGSSLQYVGYSNGGTKGPKPGYGGYTNGGAANQPNTGSSLQNVGYPNGGTKGPKPGYGAKAGTSNGQGANPNGYGGYPDGGAANQPNSGSSLQNMGYPNGGTKGPKPGYGAKAGPSSGQGAKPNGYGGYINGGAANQPNTGSSLQNMGYPNGGTKGPKPGYGAKAGPSTGQAAKPNGYGVPGYMSKGPYKAANSGYMPVTTGKQGASSGNGPKGEILSRGGQSHAPVTSNTKGFLPLSGHEQNIGLRPGQTKDVSPVLQQTKGQNLHPQGKAPNSMAPWPAPNPFMQGPGSYKPSKAYKPKPVATVASQSISAESAPIPQTSQTVGLEQEQVLSQEQNIRPELPQARISSQVPLVPGSAQSTTEIQQSKIQSNKPVPQMKNPMANPELTHLGQPNGQMQGAIPSKPDCGPGGQPNGQWVKLPSLGYPNGKGEVASQPGYGAGMGGYPAHGMNNGYKAGYGGYGNQLKNPAGPQGEQPTGFKGKSQAKYGIGGLPFGASPNGYQTNPSGQYGNDGQRYGAKSYNPKAFGKYGHGSLPYNSQPLLPESVARSSGKYDFGGLPYNGQPHGYGQKGLQNGGQPLDLRPDAVSGKYGQGSPESLYNPETISFGGDANYGNPAVSYELLGPVTDGQSVDENRSLETLHQGPEIDGQKAIDQYGDGEVQPHPDAPEAGYANAQSIEKYGTGDYTNGRIQPEGKSNVQNSASLNVANPVFTDIFIYL